MLESFVNVYGLDLVFGDGQKGRFFRQVKISAPVDEELNLMASDGFRGQAFSARVMMSFSVEDAQRTANVSMAYAIDWNRYERDLRLLSKP